MMPNHHFTVHNDGTVMHKTTGLMWKVCSGVATNYPWDVALQVPQNLNSVGDFPLSGNSITLYGLASA